MNILMITLAYDPAIAFGGPIKVVQNDACELVRGVRIGRKSFIGRGSFLMPGADIGENCIIGDGSAIRGKRLDTSIVIGYSLARVESCQTVRDGN